MVKRAKARLVGETFRKQENLEAVIAGAAQKVLALPPPSNVREDQSARLEDSQDNVEDPLSQDWASTFSDVAENATSDELRERLSRMLAGEISARGAFPRSTIRAIAELDKADLEAFVKVAPFIVGDIVTRSDTIGSELLLLLSDAGLINHSDVISYRRTWTSDVNKPGAYAGVA